MNAWAKKKKKQPVFLQESGGVNKVNYFLLQP
jgi:hypothetical protein